MSAIIINSDASLSNALGTLRELYQKHRFVKFTPKTGKARSLDQNAISHVWYEQIARELREDDALGWKSYCKLHHGVPLLRSEDEEFRESYDAVIKSLPYEKKLIAMRHWPVSSLMTKEQLSKYLESIKSDFESRGVSLKFPEME